MILRVSGDWRFSMLFPVIFLAIANIFLAYFIFRKILGSKTFAVIALLVFFLGGGLGGYQYLKQAASEKMTPTGLTGYLIDNNVTTVTKYDSVYPDQNIAYGAPMGLAFEHQRSFFIGLTAFFIFLWILLLIKEGSEKKYLPIIRLTYIY